MADEQPSLVGWLVMRIADRDVSVAWQLMRFLDRDVAGARPMGFSLLARRPWAGAAKRVRTGYPVRSRTVDP